MRDCDSCENRTPNGCTKWACEYRPIYWRLYDSKTDRAVFTGTEDECEEFTKQEPERNFYMIKLKDATNATK